MLVAAGALAPVILMPSAFDSSAALSDLNCRMAEYTKAVIDGRPCFHISLVVDVSPNCDCHCENDAPILPNIGMFASFDPLALDQACVDACMAATPLPGSQLAKNMEKPDFGRSPRSFYQFYAGIGMANLFGTCRKNWSQGTREYELLTVK